jgi:hypothetical protein
LSPFRKQGDPRTPDSVTLVRMVFPERESQYAKILFSGGLGRAGQRLSNGLSPRRILNLDEVWPPSGVRLSH